MDMLYCYVARAFTCSSCSMCVRILTLIVAHQSRSTQGTESTGPCACTVPLIAVSF